MAPGNNDRRNGNSQKSKSKPRNNINVPQEAVTPTRRDMNSANYLPTPLDWVPVSEYNLRSNYNAHNSQRQRKTTNSSATDHDFSDLETQTAYDSTFGRFVPVKPQPRASQRSNMQQGERQSTSGDHIDEINMAGPSNVFNIGQQPTNGLNPHSNHPPAAVMIVNPTTPNTVAGGPPAHLPQNVPVNTSRNNLTRVNSGRVSGDGAPTYSGGSLQQLTIVPGSSNGSIPSRGGSTSTIGPKPCNLLNNVYDGSTHSLGTIDTNQQTSRQGPTESVRAMVATCPDAVQVERRLGQIREYIRVTSSLVDTMRNSEDEAYIEHTREEYDELVEMVMKLKDSEANLVKLLDNYNEGDVSETKENPDVENSNKLLEIHNESDKPECDKDNVVIEGEKKSASVMLENFFQKINTIEKSIQELNKSVIETKSKVNQDETNLEDMLKDMDTPVIDEIPKQPSSDVEIVETDDKVAVDEVKDIKKQAEDLNEALKQNIKSCNEKLALIETLKEFKRIDTPDIDKDQNTRPMSVQSNGSAYSDNELWQNELKAKVELSQHRLAALQEQQKRLIKYQADAKQQLAEMHRLRISEENLQDALNFQAQNESGSQTRFQQNQVGVATTVTHSTVSSTPLNSGRVSAVGAPDENHSSRQSRHNIQPVCEDSDQPNWAEIPMSERGRALQQKLSELQQKKQHMEDLVSQFQRLQSENGWVGSAETNNTYHSSDEESVPDENQLGNKRDENVNTEDSFNFMEISAIKAALENAKEMMRTAQGFDDQNQDNRSDNYQMPGSSNRSDSARNESQGGVARLQNYIELHKKLNNRREDSPASSTRHNRASNATLSHKMLNETRRSPGPLERKQISLKAELEDKQRQLAALINKEKEICEVIANSNEEQHAPGINQSYHSDPEDGAELASSSHVEHSQAEQHARAMQYHVQNTNPNSFNELQPPAGPSYVSDSDSGSRMKRADKSPRGRHNRPATINRPSSANNEQQGSTMTVDQSLGYASPQPNSSGFHPNMMSPFQPNIPQQPPWCKSNQDLRPNQFTQNSHSQTMDQQSIMSSPHMPFPPYAFGMMMPYGAGGCPGCSVAWWCWHQLTAHQREIQQLKLALNQLSERWPEEPALNNRVAPGTRANNYWDNFRSYSRQNLLSSNSKTNADGQFGLQTTHSPHPLVQRSHNPLHAHAQTSRTPPTNTPKRNAANTNRTVPANLQSFLSGTNRRRNTSPDSVHTVASAPDVLNVNQNNDLDSYPEHINKETQTNINNQSGNANVNREAQRNLNISNPMPEIIEAHSNNLNSSNKMKSSSKLPAKNASNRRNCTLDYVTNRNIDIVSTSAVPNPNLASTSSDTSQDKATSKVFDLLRENVYSEVTALISANESHPDFLIQLFRDLQQVSSDSLRQHTLQSIRNILNEVANNRNEHTQAFDQREPFHINNSRTNGFGVINFMLSKTEEICTPELLENLRSLIQTAYYESGDVNLYSGKRLQENLARYEGARLCDVSDEIIHDLIEMTNTAQEDVGRGSEISESSIMQDVAGSMNIFSSSDLNLNYQDQWNQQESEAGCSRMASGQESKVDLIECSEMYNGDLAEADQTCPSEGAADSSGNVLDVDVVDVLPDVVDTEEATPTEAESEWLGLDRVPTRLHMEDPPANQKE